MVIHWKWKLLGACTVATLFVLAGTLIHGGAWLISLLGVRFILALGGVGAFLGWGWSFGKAVLPPEKARVPRLVRVARRTRYSVVSGVRRRTALPESIRRRMETLGCAPT